jgi:hypothetical protein
MNWKVMKTEAEHKRAVKRAMKIFHAEPGTPFKRLFSSSGRNISVFCP